VSSVETSPQDHLGLHHSRCAGLGRRVVVSSWYDLFITNSRKSTDGKHYLIQLPWISRIYNSGPGCSTPLAYPGSVYLGSQRQFGAQMEAELIRQSVSPAEKIRRGVDSISTRIRFGGVYGQ